MSEPIKDKAESIRHRLRNLLRERGEDMQFGLQRYAIERFLYRLGVSAHRERFVLKGAALFALWGGSVYRPTRDLDLTGYVNADEKDVLAALREICLVSNPADELFFDPNTLSAEPIRDDSEYRGLRIRLEATLATSRIPIQIDIGFGNAVEPPPQEAEYPTLLDDSPPRIRTYPPEAVIAEKLHAMVVLGERNSRYKDFYDVHVLARQFRFDDKTLARAIAATFERRQTPITAARPVALTPRFFADEARAQQWRAYVTSNSLPAVPADFDSVGELIRQFLEPVWTALAENVAFASSWRPGGSWNPEETEKNILMARLPPAGTRPREQKHSDNTDTVGVEDVEITITTPLRRFKPYPAYKDSDVEWLGKIPAAWNLKRLKRVVDFQGGGTPAKENIEYWQGDIPWVSPKDMKVSIIVDTEDKITPEAIRQSATRLIPAGAVLIVVRSGILVHSIPVALASCEVTLNQDLKAMIPDSELVPEYLMYLISGMQRELLVEWKKEGATVESLELELVANTPTPLPSVNEQRAIATFLDRETTKLDSLLAKKERLVELLQEKRAALITRAVTKGLDPNVPLKDSGVDWLGQIPAHWELKPLGSIIRYISYGFTNPMPVDDEGPYMLTANDIGDGTILYESARRTTEQAFVHDLTDKSRPRENDLLLTKDGTLGRVAVFDGRRACINQSVALLRIDQERASIDFIQNLLRAHNYQDRMIFDAGGTTIKHIYISRVVKMPVALPPEKQEQEAISSHIQTIRTKLDALIDKTGEGIGRLKELRTALISAAVTGKIDVREEAA
jgi:type I restriction enzyme, S subunit